jgi:hypothetical protein
MVSQETVTPVETGVQLLHNYPQRLDSGLGKMARGQGPGMKNGEAVLAAERLAVQGDTVGTLDELAAFPALQRTLHLPGPIAGVNPAALAADLAAINHKWRRRGGITQLSPFRC